ncbi:MAG: bifunctional phosphopantothenoylcysteine decarboxylase/phosphopantothenate--cysteine ligase CoaBC [Desulfobacterales bacterium]|nr:bifunctional phosphopantothenoylcysteine decarboxylase/phosphopantothenate--cysteine ligase CoaBC [Desulfobacterales bacterium]MDD4071821.1 bifunctional phosphopantothenoylcysteine decarboxylase/phosphopantothenate--cysteine ligase CoaBC [Desulfobacterales bacterium]MDD4392528.1 bifunctional phosphopantothenoylcysteine decarboxylase/phosphopantothenate--cysteine ligase CoaBC [Desulfobacterales bacterium]
MFKNKQIVLGVCGGIAVYKGVELLRLLKKHGADVRVIMTQNAQQFVCPMTFEVLSEQPVWATLFGSRPDPSIRHISWAEEADAVIIAPATANIIGKLAAGIADDALSTFLLAVTAPVIICPAMNTHMYQSRQVQRNLETLRADGYHIIEPASGKLACGTTGPGRLPEPEALLDRARACLTPKDLAGKRVLVTAGPTREPIDPVRFVSNPSSGKMGFAVARAAEYRGADVTLVTGPVTLTDPENVSVIRISTARQMADAVFEHMDSVDIVIKTAAVSDYRPVDPAAHKIKKQQSEMVLNLTQNPDILKELGRRKTHQILVGFAAETQDLSENAGKKLAAKNLDIIVGNLIGQPASGFETDTNKVTLFFKDGTVLPLPAMEKDEVANVLLDHVKGLRNE